MGWYLRKSFRLGPLRFNLSKSGLGASVGVPGLRVGTGPRGSYVHAGRGGVYYRTALGGPVGAERQTTDAFQDIDTIEASRLSAPDYTALLETINLVHERRALWPELPVAIALALTAAIGALWHFARPWYDAAPLAWWLGAAAIVLLAGWVAWRHDGNHCRLTMSLQMDEATQTLFDRLRAGFGDLAASSALWHVEASADVLDRKREAGSDSVVQRTRVAGTLGRPPRVDPGVDVPVLPAGRQTLYFFPFGVFVFERSVGLVPYSTLDPSVAPIRFAETENVPADATVLDRTWQYTNKRGGPDRRFGNNPELPILHYGQILLRSPTGLREKYLCSRPSAAEAFVGALLAIRGAGVRSR